jgi:phosphate:Na+ symporter
VSEPPVINDRVPHLRFLNEQMLRTPVIAISQMKAEIENMAEQAIQNFQRSIRIVTTMDFSEVEAFRKTEILLNYLNKELVDYSVKLSGKRLNSFDQRYISSTIRTVSDLERIGDYAENIVEYAEALKEQNATFSEDAVSEILKMEQLILALYKETMQAYHKLDLKALERANQIEEEIDDYTEQMERNHIDRLVKGACTPSVGAEYLSLAQNSERIGDHLTNVGKTIRDLV